MRYVSLAVYLVVGFLIGNTIADLIVAIAIPTWRNHLGQTLLILLFGGTGAFAGYGAWRRKHAPIQTDVHGSAQWATYRQVRAALGQGDGLIVGRQPKRGGQLLRYSGAAHLVTIAPTRSGKGVGAILPKLLTRTARSSALIRRGESARVAARAQYGATRTSSAARASPRHDAFDSREGVPCRGTRHRPADTQAARGMSEVD